MDSGKFLDFVFWLKSASPHMVGLISELQVCGNSVLLVVEETISEDRKRLGWGETDVGKLERIFISDGFDIDTVLNRCVDKTVHLTQGLSNNGYVSKVIQSLSSAGVRWGAIMETVDDRGLKGVFKRWLYKARLCYTKKPRFVLAIGDRTEKWVVERGFNADFVFPFAYFLPQADFSNIEEGVRDGYFTFGYVGQLIRRKRVDLLIRALSNISTSRFRLVVVGNGSLELELKELVKDCSLEGQVRFVQSVPMEEARKIISTFDCLVLPSDHDGWGAVVSESLLGGVPSICSDACGSAVAVKASAVGAVFAKGDISSLEAALIKCAKNGPLNNKDRMNLAEWAKCLSVKGGASFLLEIKKYLTRGGMKPNPPWGL